MNPLQLVSLIIGINGVLWGFWALRSPESSQAFFKKLPRNQVIGRFLIAIDLIWSLYLYYRWTFDLGGMLAFFNPKSPGMYILGPLFYWLIIRYADQYLGARSIALFLILVAKPILWICFLRSDSAALIITTLAYVWIVFGMCVFAVPHWMRDMIDWWQVSPQRWSWGNRSKIGFGMIFIVLGLFVY